MLTKQLVKKEVCSELKQNLKIIQNGPEIQLFPV